MMSSDEQKGKKTVSFKPSELRLPSSPGEEIRLIGSKCPNCGVVYLGKSRFCRNCSSRDILEEVLGRKGKLISYTIIHVPPNPLWKGPMPYAVGRVALQEGAEITSQIVNCAFEKLRVGMEMEVIFESAERDEEGNDVIVYRLNPA